METKLIILKISLGCANLSQQEASERLEEVKNSVSSPKDIPGFHIETYYVMNGESNASDITLLYPIPNPLYATEEMLPLMVAKGEMTQEVADKILEVLKKEKIGQEV